MIVAPPLEAPAPFVATIGRPDPDVCAGATATIVLSSTRSRLAAETVLPAIDSAVRPVKYLPLIVSSVPPATAAVDGLTEVTVGTCGVVSKPSSR